MPRVPRAPHPEEVRQQEEHDLDNPRDDNLMHELGRGEEEGERAATDEPRVVQRQRERHAAVEGRRPRWHEEEALFEQAERRRRLSREQPEHETLRRRESLGRGRRGLEGRNVAVAPVETPAQEEQLLL